MIKVQLCESHGGPFDLGNDCIRAYWSAFLPLAVIIVSITNILVARLPERYRPWHSTLSNFLPLEEAVHLQNDKPVDPASEQEEIHSHDSESSAWKKGFLAVPAAVETIYWLFWTLRYVYLQHDSSTNQQIHAYEIITSSLLTLAWAYAATRPLFIRGRVFTVPYDLFTLYLSMLVVLGGDVGSIVYKHYIHHDDPSVTHARALFIMVDLFLLSVLLATVVSLPIGVPPPGVDKAQIGVTIDPEDYTSFLGWITFFWVYPLVKKGTGRTLSEEEVWALPPGLSSKPLFIKYSAFLRPSEKTKKRLSLIKGLWKANSVDIILDFVLTFVSIVCNYLGPFFLKRILDAVSQPSSTRPTGESGTWLMALTTPLSQREVRAQAYVYAILAFLATVVKAQADVLHLWYGRRAATRMKSELMAAIFEKSLKRRDLSGSINKEEKEAKKSDVKGKGKANGATPTLDKKESLKTGADIGKIVNLMSNDAGRISNMMSSMYFLYGAPFELIIGSVFIYKLLGWSGFAGFVVLIVGAPLNNYLVRRGRDIMKVLLEARDKRMKILNEVISEAKFIKFGAAEDKWIEKCLNARGKELQQLVKSVINSVGFSLTWSIAPVMVSVISFTAYVYSGHQLTVAIAFTAVQIFSMIKMPMNVIPAFMAMLLTTQVAIDRINEYLDEDEVPAFVSSLLEEENRRQEEANPSDTTTVADIERDEMLGIKNGSFKWNESTTSEKKATKGPPFWKVWTRLQKKKEMSGLPTVAEGRTPGSATPVPRFELRDINIIFPNGKMTVVTGPTASGKTALLLALLGEMTPAQNDSSDDSTKPRIFLPKNPTQVEKETGLRNCIAYCAQSPWLEHLSIRDNILFGSPFDRTRYDQVIEACALKPDLDIFEDGDQTEIGARGVSLSGGQKARVALARAIYARSKHVILDDPLSAVDSHTARHLVEKLLCGPLMANRTVILVTHHVELVLPSAQYFVRMLDGRIDTQGTVSELQSRGLLDAFVHDAATADEPEVVTQEELAIAAGADQAENDILGEATLTKAKKPKKLIEDEARATGSVKWKVYKAYLQATGYLTWFLLLIILGISQLGGVVEKLWMQIWGEAGSAAELMGAPLHFSSLQTTLGQDLLWPEHHQDLRHLYFSNRTRLSSVTDYLVDPLPIDHLPSANEHPLFYVSIFACIGLGLVLVSIVGQVILAIGSYRASKLMFQDLLKSVMGATMRWFDTTPTGRILNRFSKDIETVDSSLSYSLRSTLVWIAAFIASVLTITIIFPGFLIPGSIIGYCYYQLSKGYLDAGRDLRRMESTTRSPIFASFGETLEGIITVRAFSAERRFLDTLHSRIDQTTKHWYFFWMLNRWLLLNFDVLGGLAVLITTLLVLGGWIADWLAGLTITSSMNFTMSVYWTCRMITALELDLNSVERVVEYLELPQEPPSVIENHRPPAYWPSSTTNEPMISISNLVIKYAPTLPPVLHGVSFDIKPKEKVGLLGRTGSGKSTLAMSLLRFVDPAEGSIKIDGIDIGTIGLHDLRSRLTIIPQDSVLFTGTVRENLDPFSDHTDEECLDALYRVQLISETTHASRRSTRPPSITNAESSESSGTATPQEDKTSVNLDTDVSARGANFSAGQRQLISMARALLRRSSIVILDEATSSIDFKTDAKIQAAVREEFKESCLLTIAHRIKTVIDYDRLLVLDKGKVVEFDTPYNLIRKEGGLFREMCLKSGTFGELEQAAKEAAGV